MPSMAGGGVFVDHNAFRLAQVFQVAFSSSIPISSEMTVSPVRVAISCSIVTTAPKQGALTAATFTMAWCNYRVASASPSSVFSDDNQRFACFRGFQHRQHFADVGDFLVSQVNGLSSSTAQSRLVDEV
jgi:hypothetical protein